MDRAKPRNHPSLALCVFAVFSRRARGVTRVGRRASAWRRSLISDEYELGFMLLDTIFLYCTIFNQVYYHKCVTKINF